MAQSHNISLQFVDPADGVIGKKNPIIFLHCMLCSKVIWTDIPQAVADSTGRRVYTYDARNHGQSMHTVKSNFNFNVDDLYHLMAQIKEDTKSDKIVIVGHDMGGMTAISAALKAPNSFEMVFIVEMSVKRLPDSIIDRMKGFITEWTRCIQELPKDTPKDEVTKASVETLYENLHFKEYNEKESYQKGKFEYKETEEGYEPLYNATALVAALDELKNEPQFYKGMYCGPVYFFYGTKSHYNIADEETFMKEHFPAAKLVPFDDASHFFVADKSTELAKELSKCINSES